MRSARIVLPSLVVLVLLAAASAVGGEKGAPGSPSNPLVALPNPSPTRIPPPAHEGPRQADGTQLDEPKPTSTKTQQGSTAMHAGKPMVAPPETPRQQKEQAPSASRPCSLVTKAEAREIIGAPIVEPLQAPQGPTCIYQTESGKPYVTIAGQDTSIGQLREQLSDRVAVSVAGRAGYCGTAGGPVLYVPLSDGRTLVVAARCEMARRFAARAFGRL